jgi:putative Ca2+/H+ antiporter (TMEM165/GDT1 family)
MEALLLSIGLVALAEIGDKTQLLALLLAARWRRPWPIVWGIFVATLVNHALAGAFGSMLAHWAGPQALRWVLGLGFVAMALWVLRPDEAGEPDPAASRGWGVFAATCIAFFLAEMGDKTQLATVALAARFDGALLAVVVGTTLGMMLANVPVVFLGERALRALPPALVRRAASLLFLAVGVWTLAGGADGWWMSGER